MKRLMSILCLCLVCCLVLFGCSPKPTPDPTPNPTPNPTVPDDGGNDGGNGGDNDGDNGDGSDATIKNIAGFDNLACELATVNIVTADGEDITGDMRHQEYKQCEVTVTGGRDGENFASATGKVRVRGNNTAEYPKKSYRIKFDQKINMFGLNDGAECKNWVLLACYKDVTFLRDAVVFELAKQTLAEQGLYASDYCFAEVQVNGVYNGLYMVAEQQQVNKNRINIFEPDDGYTGNDIGWLVEFDGNAFFEPADIKFKLNYRTDGYEITCEDGTKHFPGQTGEGGVAWYTIKNDIYSTEQRDFINSYTQNVFKIIYDAIYKNEYYKFNADFTELVSTTEFASGKDAIAAAVNIESMVDTFIINEIACDNDIDWSSFFFTVDMSSGGDGKLTFQAPWDFDSGFGMMRGLETGNLDKIFSANVCTNAMQALNPWLSVFFSADWFRTMVAERFSELDDAGVFARLTDLVEKVTATYKPYFDKNYEKWDNLGKIVDEVQSSTMEEFTTHAEAAAALKEFVAHRVEFLRGYFETIRSA